MTADQFYTVALMHSEHGKAEFDRRYVVLVCRCGGPNCEGWVLSGRRFPVSVADRCFPKPERRVTQSD